jgi:cytochrome c-type biogenesis protein CcmH
MNTLLRLSSIVVAAVLLTGGSSRLRSAESVLSFQNPGQEALYNQLIQEYRCLKCQNQNLADSAADLAGDLRREIHVRIVEGKSRDDIDSYLVARYGDFVLYRPPFKPTTYLLWIGPFVLLAVAIAYAVRLGRRGKKGVAEAGTGLPNEARLDEARRLLGE